MSSYRIREYQFPFCIYATILLLTIHASSFAANTYVIPIKLTERPNFKPMSYMTSKVMGACVKTALYIDQWFPNFSGWMKSIKPTLTIAGPINTDYWDTSDSSEEYDC